MPFGPRKRPSGSQSLADRRRPTARERGYDHRWQIASKMFLKANPLCREHLKRGRLVRATQVDHIIPHRGNYELFWNKRNWQGLCIYCHSSKTAKEDGGFGHPRVTGHVEADRSATNESSSVELIDKKLDR